MNKRFIYIYCRDYIRFLEYSKENQSDDIEFLMIDHCNFLNARTPGEILIVDPEEELEMKWDHIGIMESIMFHKDKWKNKIMKNDNSENEEFQYGV